MTSDEVRLIDLNLVESLREFSRWQDGVSIVEEEGLLLSTGESRMANTALRLDPELSANESLERMRTFYRERGRGFLLTARGQVDGDLDEALLPERKPVGNIPWMVLRKPIVDRPAPSGSELRVVETEEAVRDFAEVAGEAFASKRLPAEEHRGMFANPRGLLSSHVVAVVAYVEGQPVSTAMALLSHGIAVLYYAGTKEAFRRRGLGELCIRAVGNAGFERGARFAALHASQMGEPVYRGMGYEVVSSHRMYIFGRKDVAAVG